MPILSRPRDSGPNRGKSRARLLGAVEELLGAGGSYADLTVEQITERAGIARSTFYVHFRDRRELLVRLVEQLSEPLFDRLQELRQADSAPNPKRLQEAIHGAVVFAREHAGVLRALSEAAAYDVEVRKYREEVSYRFVEAVGERLERQQRQGNGLPLPPRAGAIAFVTMVAESCMLQISSDTGVSDSDLSEALALVWGRGAYLA